ncbi:MAG TPA: polyprenyl diphosphate synthase [Terriglobia bacterium]|nr:polyprenyl diphosphate synthase [Terriglobia bacterium]
MNFPTAQKSGRVHVAIIMDGNGRWATLRGLPRSAGHRAGAARIPLLVQAAMCMEVEVLTLYAFSGNNWARPEGEVAGIMKLFEDFIRAGNEEWRREGIRVSVIGRRDRLPLTLLEAIEAAERNTRAGGSFQLRLAIDYSGQDIIVEAARRLRDETSPTRDDFARLMALASHARPEDAEVDLLIRTGGEQRLSDFLLWELAYAELWFSEKLWPDFTPDDLAEAVRAFEGRERRFGRLTPSGRDEEASLAVHALNH